MTLHTQLYYYECPECNAILARVVMRPTLDSYCSKTGKDTVIVLIVKDVVPCKGNCGRMVIKDEEYFCSNCGPTTQGE